MSINAIKFINSEYSFEKTRNLVVKALEMVDIFIPENQERFIGRMSRIILSIFFNWRTA